MIDSRKGGVTAVARSGDTDLAAGARPVDLTTPRTSSGFYSQYFLVHHHDGTSLGVPILAGADVHREYLETVSSTLEHMLLRLVDQEMVALVGRGFEHLQMCLAPLTVRRFWHLPSARWSARFGHTVLSSRTFMVSLPSHLREADLYNN